MRVGAAGAGGDRGRGVLRVSTAAPAAPAVSPPLARPRLYYGWVLVGALAVTEMVSYGVLQYAFPVFLAPMEAELGWSRTAMTGAFSLASLVSGFVAVPAGRWVDRHGPRGLMTAGSVLSALLLLAWAAVDHLLVFYAVWMGLGMAMSAVLYEPAFAVLARWFHRLRGRALLVLTFVAGFASVVFVPLATWLVQAHGWRDALLWLAAILAVMTVIPHALLLRRDPRDLGLRPDGGITADDDAPAASIIPSVPADRAIRSASFRWLTAAFSLSALTTTAMAVHLIPLLLERGYSPAFAGAAMGALGLMALPGRLVFTPLGSWWPRPAVTAAIFLLGALGIAALMMGGGEGWVWACVALFGAGFGGITPARAALVAEMYGPLEYGRISGVLAMWLAVARAAAPVGASVLYTLGGGYAPVLWTLLIASLAAAAAVLLAGMPPVRSPVPVRP